MRIKLDENMPEELADVLAALKHDVDTVRSEGIAGRNDTVVWAAATAEARLLVTQDLDFSDLRLFKPGTHAGILLVRLKEPTRRSLVRVVRSVFESPNSAHLEQSFAIATERKLRVRRPKLQ